jgi:hypothetical protein
VDNSDAHCSFCGKGKDEVHKLIAGGGRKVAAGRALPPVAICGECVAICANVCAEDGADLESDLHAAAAELVRTTQDVLRTPPPGFGSAPEDLKGLVIKLLEPVRESLMELEWDRPYRGARREMTDEFLVEAQKRVWDLIDDLRRARAVHR